MGESAHRWAEMKKFLKWLAISATGIFVLFVALVVFAIAGPKPAVVEGTDRPEWLPEQATQIFHRSREGFGWWKAAEFTISEKDFRAHAEMRGWKLVEVKNLSKIQTLQFLRPSGTAFSEEDSKPIPRALVFERRASNNGGISVSFDFSTDRAYYNESHR